MSCCTPAAYRLQRYSGRRSKFLSRSSATFNWQCKMQKLAHSATHKKSYGAVQCSSSSSCAGGCHCSLQVTITSSSLLLAALAQPCVTVGRVLDSGCPLASVGVSKWCQAPSSCPMPGIQWVHWQYAVSCTALGSSKGHAISAACCGCTGPHAPRFFFICCLARSC
jgi:hypothetical protein